MINYPNGHKHKEVTNNETSAVKSKYHAQKMVVDGITFDSKKEAKRYNELKLLAQSGVITNLRLQVPFILYEKSQYGGVRKYLADFVYTENGIEIVEDVKGCRTKEYLLKKRMVAEKYGIIIKET